MSSIGTGYDVSSLTFSPDGRVFQVEYAAKAVENSGYVSPDGTPCGRSSQNDVQFFPRTAVFDPADIAT